MPEIQKYEVHLVEAVLVCECGGEMTSAGKASRQGMGPTQHKHACSKCGGVEWREDGWYPRYQHTRRERVDDGKEPENGE
jgi:hypothetical protein